MPRISVIMPMRNAAGYVQAAAASVLHGQRVEDLELVVVDDGSTDGSGALLARTGDPRIRVVDGPEQGIAAALNAGVAAASGEYLARCDADDLYEPGRLRRQLEFLSARPEFVAVAGAYTAVDRRGRTVAVYLEETDAEDITDELLGGQTRTHLCTFLLRRDAVVNCGGFRTFFRTGEDIDFQLRIARQGRVWFDPVQAYRYRIHGESITHQQGDSARVGYERIARELAAERAAGGSDRLERAEWIAPPAEEGASRSAQVHLAGLSTGRAWKLHAQGRRWAALRMGLEALRCEPLNPQRWRSLLALGIKRSAPGVRGREAKQ